uniref:RRM domain-containing protein n=1 Tax=Kalanchoe fedtschenkoi TaxID=63787 RepID=A0A7N0RC70_KALFE
MEPDSPPRKRYSRPLSPRNRRARSKSRSQSRSRSRDRPDSRARQQNMSRSRSRSRSRGRTTEVINPGNTLYVTGLSTRVTERELDEHFSKEGKVASCFLVMEPRTRISRGFAFVTMDSVEDANRCIKYLNQSVLEGRYITVEKSRRKRPRTPTPGHYLGLSNSREGRGGGDRHRLRRDDDYEYRRPLRRSPPYQGGGRVHSPPYHSGREYSPLPRRSPPYSGRSRRERTRSPPPYSRYGSPDRGYTRGAR